MKLLSGKLSQHNIDSPTTLVIDLETPGLNEVDSSKQDRGKFAEYICLLEVEKLLKNNSQYPVVEILNRDQFYKRYQSYVSKMEASIGNEGEYKEWKAAYPGGKVLATQLFKVLNTVADKQVTKLYLEHTGISAAQGDSRGDVTVKLVPVEPSAVHTFLDISLKATAKSTSTPQTTAEGLLNFIKIGKGAGEGRQSKGTWKSIEAVMKYLQQSKEKYPEFGNYYTALIEYYGTEIEVYRAASEKRAADIEKLKKKYPNFVNTVGFRSKENPEQGLYFLKTVTSYLDAEHGGNNAKMQKQSKILDAALTDIKQIFSNKEYREGFIVNRLGATNSIKQKEVTNILKLAIAAHLEFGSNGEVTTKVSDSYHPSSKFHQVVGKWIEGVNIDIKRSPTDNTNLYIYVDGDHLLTFNITPKGSGDNKFPAILFQAFFNKDVTVNEKTLRLSEILLK